MKAIPFSRLSLGFVLLGLTVLRDARAAGAELLHLDFNNKGNLGAQSASLPAGTLVNNPRPSTQFPGALDLGEEGYVRVPGFISPKGPFSVEVHFRTNGYAQTESRFISDLFNSASWDSVPTQGVTLRIGGGDPYGTLDRSAFDNEEDYQANVKWYADVPSTPAVTCIGEFAIASAPGGTSAWKEVITDRCLPLESWIHMVGVWDGKDMHLYVNGQYAVDTLHMLGKAGKPNFAATATAYAGARADGGWDSRAFHGLLDYVRVVDSAMSYQEVRARYRAARVWAGGDTACQAIVIPAYPHPRQLVRFETTFRSNLVPDGTCQDPNFRPKFEKGDSMDVEISDQYDFSHIIASFRVGSLFFKIDPRSSASKDRYIGPAFWRARFLKGKSAKALAKGAAVRKQDWSLGMPVILNLASKPTSMRPYAGRMRRVMAAPGALLSVPAAGALVPELWTVTGSRFRVKWARAGAYWIARIPAGSEARMLFLDWKTLP